MLTLLNKTAKKQLGAVKKVVAGTATGLRNALVTKAYVAQLDAGKAIKDGQEDKAQQLAAKAAVLQLTPIVNEAIQSIQLGKESQVKETVELVAVKNSATPNNKIDFNNAQAAVDQQGGGLIKHCEEQGVNLKLIAFDGVEGGDHSHVVAIFTHKPSMPKLRRAPI